MNAYRAAAIVRRWLAASTLLLLSIVTAPAMAQNCNGFANSLSVDPAAQNAQEFDVGNGYGPVTVTLTIKNTTSLPNGASLVWTQTSGPAVTLNTTNPLRPTFVAPSVGAAGATLGFSAQARCNNIPSGNPALASVSILNVDRPPSVTALASPPIANAGDTVTLTANGSDPDGDAITYTWTQISNGAPAVVLGSPGAASTGFVAPSVPAEATLEFRVEARAGALARTATVTVTVTAANLPPFAALSCTPAMVGEGQLITLDGTASEDPEGAPLTYEWFINEMEVGLDFSLAGELGDYVERVAPNLGLGMSGGVEVRLRVSESPTVFTDATCSFMILDVTAPVIDGGGDRTVDATSPAGANVDYGLTATDNVEGDLTPDLVCVPPSGSAFALNVPTDVACEVRDINNNLATAEFEVAVRDLTAPVIDAHDDVAVEAEGPLTSVSYAPPGTLDVVDVDLDATCAPPSGTSFAVGSHTITCDASDTAGNPAASTTFTLTVHDSTAPVITVPPPITAEATSPQGAAVPFEVSASDIADTDVAVECSADSGDVFALGTTLVTCNAADDSGNASEASFSITVVDTTVPVILGAAEANQTLEATSPAGAVATFALTATDIADPDVAVQCSPNSGDTFALGSTTVDCTATDNSGNQATASFSIVVEDTTIPVISGAAEANQTLEATSPAGAVATFALTATDIADPDVAVQCSPSSGATFALGSTTVNCTATDDSGNQANASFTIVVEDTTAPVLTLPGNLVAEATSAAGATVGFTATAFDLVSGNVAVDCTPASGSTFPLGAATIVNCGATDGAGNTGSGSFTVTVRDTTPPTIAPHDDVFANASSNSSAVVTYTSPTAIDLVDGLVPVSCTPVSGSTFNVGTTTVTCTAQDGRTPPNVAQSTTFKVIVSYTFNGFFQPIDNNVTNAAKAGSAIPVKFTLGGNQGLNIFAAGSPTSQAVSCDSQAPIDEIETTVTAGGSTLQYDAASGQYIYVWKTEKNWIGCRQLRVTLRDGSVRTAMFKFR